MKRKRPLLLLIFLSNIFFLVLPSTSHIAIAQTFNVWIGTGGPEGIHHLTLDGKKGVMSRPRMVADIRGSGFLAIHPNGEFLYSTMNAGGAGHVAAFRISRAGENPTLKLLNRQPIGDGGAACIAIDKTGRTLVSAQYGGGSVATFPIQEDGSLGPRVELVEHGRGSGVNENRQADAHPHWVGTSPDNHFLLVPDLGMDKVMVYELDPAAAKLTPHSQVPVPPGSGPRHMKFHTSNKYAYVLNELNLTVSSFKYDESTAVFEPIDVVETLPNDQQDRHLNSAAEIRVHPSGKYLYTSNRGHDSISVFAVDPDTGKLTFVEREHVRGSWPRNFNLDPTGKWLIAAGQKSNTLALFEIQNDSGELVFARQVVNSPSPICVLFGQPVRPTVD
jgi:6-phosphogluconolactonase